jgi:hypothetical protein
MSGPYFFLAFFFVAFFFIESLTSSHALLNTDQARSPYFFFFLAAFFFATDELTSFLSPRAIIPSVAHGFSAEMLRLVGSPGLVASEVHEQLRK